MKKINLLSGIIGLIYLLFLPLTASGQGISAEEITRKAHLVSYYQGKDGKGSVKMKIFDKRGRVRERVMTMLRKDQKDGGDQKYFIHFQKPNDVRDMTFLVNKHPDRNDDRWLYIPSIHMVKRVAASDKRGSFAGSDFTYEDISGRSVHLDEKRLLREEKLAGRPVYVIENRPRDVKEVEYSYRHTYIAADNFVTLREVYFNKKDEAIKEYYVQEVKNIAGYPTVISAVMKNLKKGRKTEIYFSNIAYDLNLNDKIFSERSLKRPPRKWLR